VSVVSFKEESPSAVSTAGVFLMDTSTHDMAALFAQLGLDNSSAAIEQFIHQHQLHDRAKLTEALFWSAGQIQFLKDCYREDSDWIPIVDDLNAQLHQGI
jgi:hypothetical protein